MLLAIAPWLCGGCLLEDPSESEGCIDWIGKSGWVDESPDPALDDATVVLQDDGRLVFEYERDDRRFRVTYCIVHDAGWDGVPAKLPRCHSTMGGPPPAGHWP